MLFDTPQPMVSADRALSNRPLLSRWSMRSNVRMIRWDFVFFISSQIDCWFHIVIYLGLPVFFSLQSVLYDQKEGFFCVCLFCNCEILILLYFSHIHSFQIHLENVCLSTVFSNTHRVEFSIFYSNTHYHDIPMWCQYKNWFSDTLLCIEPEISITSHENNPLVNSRPETFVILVKHTINEQGAAKG